MASLLIGDLNKIPNINNLIGRVTYGLIGVELRAKGDESYRDYLEACISIYKELNIGNGSQYLMSLFDYEIPSKVNALGLKFRELEPLIKSVETNNEQIENAKSKLENILEDLYEFSRTQESAR